MGQYHSIYNKTKKEFFSIGGAKLWEKAHEATAAAMLMLLSNSNGRGGGDFMVYADKHDPKTYEPILSVRELVRKTAIDQVSGRWAGDVIVVQGDYAQEGDAGFMGEDELKDFTDVSELVAQAILAADPERDSNASKIVIREAASDYGSLKGMGHLKEVQDLKKKDAAERIKRQDMMRKVQVEESMKRGKARRAKSANTISAVAGKKPKAKRASKAV